MNKLNNLKHTLLLGPGPSTVSPNVYKALATHTIGHLDPRFIEIMDEIKILLRRLFKTENDFCMPVSGTGSAAMESCFVNMLNPNDKIFYTTGRLTSEMVIKAVKMGIPILISRSGFTSWGVELAQQTNLTLIGRAKGKKYITLSGHHRVIG